MESGAEIYFKTKYKEISTYLQEVSKAGKVIAIWGAGYRGQAFLRAYDPNGQFIKLVFDKQSQKWGQILPTGHIVADFGQKAAVTDIVFVVMSAFLMDTAEQLEKCGFHGQIICVDDWLLAGVRPGVYSQGSLDTVEKKCSACLAAMVILYQPKHSMIDSLGSYADDVERIYIYDNSPDNHAGWFSSLPWAEKITYIFDGTNQGLGTPINRVAEMAKSDGMDWLLTFDQDSVAASGMVQRMRDYVESTAYDELVVMVAPVVHMPVDGDNGKPSCLVPETTYVRWAIQSGSMLKLDVLRKIYYKGELFIDLVDTEYCVRLLLAGYRIIRLTKAVLEHQREEGEIQLGTTVGDRLYARGKFSPDRYYYQYRNMLYCAEWYKESQPDFADWCQRSLLRIEGMAKTDYNVNLNILALEEARADYECGRLGQRA